VSAPGPPAARRGELCTTRVDASRWRDACVAALERGGGFAGLFSTPGDGDGAHLRAVFAEGEDLRMLVCDVPHRTVESIVAEIPAAAWDEREAHDRHQIRFSGHEPMRPLLDHSAALERWTVPVKGRDVHQVAVGPVHAGVIESGHFRFHVVGERILHLDVRLFYKRRGLESAAAGRDLDAALRYAQRACAACAVANGVAYAQACEQALGLAPDEEVRRARTLLLELERLYNHLHDISAICAGVGFAAGTMTYTALKERAQRLNERLTGHRFLFDSVRVGGSDQELTAEDVQRTRAALRELREVHATSWRQLLFVSSLQARLRDVGILASADARALGAVGPAARASAIAHDARTASARLWYPDFVTAVADSASGDVASRAAQRALELEQSFTILDELLSSRLARGATSAARDGGATGAAAIESPRGRTVCVIERDGSRLRSLHLRTGSYANWPALAHAVAGNLLPEFPLINKSFELCYACADR
jgi:Ni,Fe-hydrogenase III large subunit